MRQVGVFKCNINLRTWSLSALTCYQNCQNKLVTKKWFRFWSLFWFSSCSPILIPKVKLCMMHSMWDLIVYINEYLVYMLPYYINSCNSFRLALAVANIEYADHVLCSLIFLCSLLGKNLLKVTSRYQKSGSLLKFLSA